MTATVPAPTATEHPAAPGPLKAKTAVLYHDHCPDGWTAAWVAARSLGDAAALLGVSHGNPPPDLTGADEVYLVDFAYPHETLVKLAEGRRLVVLDHHRTAIDDISFALTKNEATAHSDPAYFTTISTDPYRAVLDTNRSGAGITWDWFHPGEPRPWVVDYVEDRDLWRFKLASSKEVSAYIRSQPHTLDRWDALVDEHVEVAADIGAGVLLHIDAYCRAAANHAYWCQMGGRRFPVVNVTYEACSEVAAHLLDQFDTDMAGYFFERGEGGWQYGFRSRNGVTVHDHAVVFGGGGHPQAAGCVVFGGLAHQRIGVPS